MSEVYIIKGNEYYKIGLAADVDRRLSELQLSTPYKIDCVHSFQADKPREAERFLHKLFKSKCVQGEWFRLSLLDISFLQTISGYEKGTFAWDSTPISTNQIENIPVEKQIFYEFEYYGEVYKITEDQISTFLQGAWRRYQSGYRPLSRNYWCKTRSPRFKTPIYQGIIKLLEEMNVIVNRRQGAQGNLVTSPGEAMALLRKRYTTI